MDHSRLERRTVRRDHEKLLPGAAGIWKTDYGRGGGSFGRRTSLREVHRSEYAGDDRRSRTDRRRVSPALRSLRLYLKTNHQHRITLQRDRRPENLAEDRWTGG